MSYSSTEYFLQWKKGVTIYAKKIDSKFYVKNWLGRGGMSEVWLVENLEWRFHFAVKNPCRNLIAPANEIRTEEKKRIFSAKI